jgi:hypothetical protein
VRKKWIYSSKIAISLIAVVGLSISCAIQSPITTPTSTPEATPTPSGYPADISGQVIVVEKVKCLTAIAVPPNKESNIFWIVDIAVKNNAYTDPVEANLGMGYKGWVIITNDKTYTPVMCGSDKMNPPIDLTIGQTGKFMFYFSMPQTLQINNAQICYKDQEPYSYGSLSFVDKVTAYDWGSKTAITEDITPTIESKVKVIEDWKIQLDGSSWIGSTVTVRLTITNLGPRRNFGYAGFDVGPEICAIDSTNKIIEPWVREPDYRKGEMLIFPGYTKEFYPNESWSGTLKFEMSPYSGKTKLYMTQYYHQDKYFLFDLGEPW